MKVQFALLVIFLPIAFPAATASDWPTLHGNAARDGATADCVKPPYERKWIRSWPLEIMTTRVEAIVGEGRVFVGTYAGRLHAIDAETGADFWTFEADGPILHSPAYADGLVYFATASPG